MAEIARTFEPNHTSASDIQTLDPLHIERQAYELSEFISRLPVDPDLEMEPRGILVGTYPLNPQAANDLDIEVQGVHWDHLQNCFRDAVGKAGIAEVKFTRAGNDGIIDSDRGDFGNAFVAVWLTLEGGRTANLSIPYRVNAATTRYDLHSREEIPDLPFEEASRRRNYAHNAVGYDRLDGDTGTIVDPHGGLGCIERNELRLLADRESFKSDPLNLYQSIYLSGKSGMYPDDQLQELLSEMGKEPLPSGANATRADRLASERRKLIGKDADPHYTLTNALEYGLIERDFPQVHAILKFISKNDGGRPGETAERAWHYLADGVQDTWLKANRQESWSNEEKFILIAGRFAFEVERLYLKAFGVNIIPENTLTPFLPENPTVREEMSQKINEVRKQFSSAARDEYQRRFDISF